MDLLEAASQASRFRRELNEDATSPIDIFALASSIESLSLFLYPLGNGISGMCIKAEDTSVVAINSTMSRGRQRFSLGHELYHYRYGKSGETAICSTSLSASDTTGVEQAADRFASYLLLPLGAYEDRLEKAKARKGKLELADLIWFEQQYGISHQAMLWRLTTDGFITPAENLALKDGVIREARRLGYDTALYRIVDEKAAERKVLGHYVQMADKLFEQNKISSGKYDELMLAGFRSDIVYGDEEDDQIDD